MDYSRVYQEFIADRRLKEHLLEVFDRHHVKPRCLKGTNDPENLIRLSYSDHLFAHGLLARIHGGVLASVFVRMSGVAKYQGRPTRLRYESLRAEHRRVQSTRTLSPEAKAKISKKNKGLKRSPESRAQMSASAKLRANDPAWRQRHSGVMKGNQHMVGRSPSKFTRDKISASLIARNKQDSI